MKTAIKGMPEIFQNCTKRQCFSTFCQAERIHILSYCCTEVKFSALAYHQHSVLHLIYFSVFQQNRSSEHRKDELLKHVLIHMSKRWSQIGMSNKK